MSSGDMAGWSMAGQSSWASAAAAGSPLGRGSVFRGADRDTKATVRCGNLWRRGCQRCRGSGGVAGGFGEQGHGQEGVESWEEQQGRVLKARKWSQARH